MRIDALGDRVPVDFEIEEMLAHAVKDEQQRRSATALVLSWVIDVDERPLLVDRALVWVHYEPAGGPESWELLHLYRHPLDGPRWHVSMVADAPHIGRMSYVKAPTSAELERFLEATWWKVDGEDGFVKLDAQICENAWKRAFGKPPERR